MEKTLKFEIVSGIGNEHLNKNSKYKDKFNYVCNIWQRIAKEEYEKNNIYISAVIRPSRTVFNELWGCPKGGEDTVVITGVANNEFILDLDAWKSTVLKLAKKLKAELGQKTMTCEFMNIELNYLK